MLVFGIVKPTIKLLFITQDWGSSDVRVRILPSNSQTTEKPLPEDPATSSLPSSGLAEEVDFEKEFLF